MALDLAVPLDMVEDRPQLPGRLVGGLVDLAGSPALEQFTVRADPGRGLADVTAGGGEDAGELRLAIAGSSRRRPLCRAELDELGEELAVEPVDLQQAGSERAELAAEAAKVLAPERVTDQVGRCQLSGPLRWSGQGCQVICEQTQLPERLFGGVDRLVGAARPSRPVERLRKGDLQLPAEGQLGEVEVLGRAAILGGEPDHAALVVNKQPRRRLIAHIRQRCSPSSSPSPHHPPPGPANQAARNPTDQDAIRPA
jgi:hypothetical protein